MDIAKPDLIRVFEHDPDLLDGLDAQTATHLRHRLVARRCWLERGRWQAPPAPEDAATHLGLLVVDGLVVRTMHLAGREASEVIGPGDLIRPWDVDEDLSVACTTQWRVLEPTVCAVLDGAFAQRAARWPSIGAALLRRSAGRCRALVHQATIAHVRHAETRLLLVLWQLADRWGRVTPDGVLVPVPLTHQLLAQLTCLQRPTVSAALSRLADAGELSRVAGSGWMLHGTPPAASEDAERAPARGARGLAVAA